MNRFIDQTGYKIILKAKPKRIISLVPSQSELLWDLGLKKELVGITKFCIHPEKMYRSVDRVGGTKKLNLDKILSLKPDIIFGNKEENEKSQIDELRKEFPVWMSDIYTLKDSYEMISNIGLITGKEGTSKQLVKNIKTKFSHLDTKEFLGKRAAYFMWHEPNMAAASDTFINSLLKETGFINVFGKLKRYPVIKDAMLKKADPEYILLSSEPYPFREKHRKEFERICPAAKILFVDGEFFSWYGSRLLKAPRYFSALASDLDG